jgi:hypothetical protein
LEQISHQPPSVWITPTHVTVVKPDHYALAWATGRAFSPGVRLAVHHGGSSLFLVAQVMMWTVDQRLNLNAARRSGLQATKIIYLEDHLSRGLHRPMFALIAIHGLLALMSGRLGLAGLPGSDRRHHVLAGDLWFESFAVPWLDAGLGHRGRRAGLCDLGQRRFASELLPC